MAAFSDPPTSQECVVSVIHLHMYLLKLNALIQGAYEWTKYKYGHQQVIGEITSASYHAGLFLYCHGKHWVVTFSLKSKAWKSYIYVCTWRT